MSWNVQTEDRAMTKFVLVASAAALTFACTAAWAGGSTRDHRYGGSPYASAQGGVRVYSGHRPHLGYGQQNPQVRPAPSTGNGGSGFGANVRDHRGR